MLTEKEERILALIAKKSLIRKTELLKFEDGSALVVVRNLIDKGLVQPVTPIGETCFAVTKRGAQILSKIAP